MLIVKAHVNASGRVDKGNLTQASHFQAIKVAKFWGFTTKIIKKQNHKDFAGLAKCNKLSVCKLPLLLMHIIAASYCLILIWLTDLIVFQIQFQQVCINIFVNYLTLFIFRIICNYLSFINLGIVNPIWITPNCSTNYIYFIANKSIACKTTNLGQYLNPLLSRLLFSCIFTSFFIYLRISTHDIDLDMEHVLHLCKSSISKLYFHLI